MAKAVAQSVTFECVEDDLQEDAGSSGQRYVSDEQSGVQHQRHGKAFPHLDRSGETNRMASTPRSRPSWL